MKLNRLLAYLIGCLCFAASFIIYMTFIYLLGFPDGHLTELEYAERTLARLFIAISLMLGAYFIYLGVVAARKPVSRKLTAATILYLITIIGLSLLDHYYRLHLDDGAGG